MDRYIIDRNIHHNMMVNAIELRIPTADLSKRLDMTLAAVSYAVKRGEKIAKEAGCHMDDGVI